MTVIGEIINHSFSVFILTWIHNHKQVSVKHNHTKHTVVTSVPGLYFPSLYYPTDHNIKVAAAQ